MDAKGNVTPSGDTYPHLGVCAPVWGNAPPLGLRVTLWGTCPLCVVSTQATMFGAGHGAQAVLAKVQGHGSTLLPDQGAFLIVPDIFLIVLGRLFDSPRGAF